jgi:hypothetical protein
MHRDWWHKEKSRNWFFSAINALSNLFLFNINENQFSPMENAFRLPLIKLITLLFFIFQSKTHFTISAWRDFIIEFHSMHIFVIISKCIRLCCDRSDATINIVWNNTFSKIEKLERIKDITPMGTCKSKM